MRTLQEAADDGHERAALAIDKFCYSVAKAAAGMIVSLGRVDALVFTGGIGENAVGVRAPHRASCSASPGSPSTRT